MKPFLRYATLFPVLLLGFTGCDSDDDSSSNPDSEPVYINVIGSGDTVEVNLLDLNSEIQEGSSVVSLEDVVTQDILAAVYPPVDPDDSLEFRTLFSYRFTASDGFSPIDHGREDLTWDIFRQGVVAVETRNTFYSPDLNLPGAYNVNELESISILRKVDITTPFSEGFARFADFETVDVDTGGTAPIPAYSLSALMPDTLVESGAEDLSYFVHFLSGDRTPSLTWQQLQDGYFIQDTEHTWFAADNLREQTYRQKYISHIEAE